MSFSDYRFLVRTALILLVAVAALAVARGARQSLAGQRGGRAEAPYTPAPSTAPFVSLGYREAAADLLYIRMRAYFGSYEDTNAAAIAALGEAVVALDPQFQRAYEYSANAMTMAPGADQSIFLRAIALLERGTVLFPANHAIPMLAGQMYIQDLKTDDPVQRRAWDERGTLLVESAIRKPGAPQQSAMWAAHLRTKLGQYERAAQGIRELLLTTNDPRLREGLLQRLADIEKSDAADLAAEVFDARKRFERTWRAERYSIHPTMYVLIGPRLTPGFDMADLATGGRDLVVTEAPQELEPLE